MEPKYRAKTLGSNEWVYGNYITMFNQSNSSEINVEHYIYDGITYYIINMTTLCQCIGKIKEPKLEKVKGHYVKKVTETDLYIGDIITTEDSYDDTCGFPKNVLVNYIVVWNEKELAVGFREIISAGVLSDEIYSLDDIGGLQGFWITGNKFDNLI